MTTEQQNELVITFSDSDGTTIAKNITTWEEANAKAREIFKRYSDLYYKVHFEDGTEVEGSIDLEPASFHEPHKDYIFTGHIRTFWTNVIRHEQQPPIGWTLEEVNEVKRLLEYVPKTFGVWCSVSGGVTGHRTNWLKNNGEVFRTLNKDIADKKALELSSTMGVNSSATFNYSVKEFYY